MNDETAALKQELESYRNEKEKIRDLIGSIGGAQTSPWERALTIAFTGAVMVLFALDVLRHILHMDVPMPPLFSVEVGVLLVSVKIIWMIHRQTKVEHFQFWILNSIEFRLNAVSKDVQNLLRRLESGNENSPDRPQ
jgi:hypothetical protein